MDNEYQEASFTSGCYFNTEDKQPCLLPMLKTNYDISINNNFAKIQMEQVYLNPFDKPLQIHFAVPTDPFFSISSLRVLYQELEVAGVVMEKEKAKVEFKKSVEKGETVMMANYSKTETSILKLRIGNIEPQEKITVKLDLIGQLVTEMENQWVLRIPSHIGPRYTSYKDILPKLYNKFLKSFEENTVQLAYLKPHIQWQFKINLNCSQKITKWVCETHQLKSTSLTPNSYQFTLQYPEPPQIDLEFKFQRENPNIPLKTYGQNCMALTFFPPEISTKEKAKNIDFIFLLDRSGSMSGTGIEAAKKSLIIYLKSLPQNSKFNIISFGSNFQKMFPTSQLYSQQIVMSTVAEVQKFSANFGGTEINQPLLSILQKQQKQPNWQRHIILLTDGQVSNTEQVIKTIKTIREKQIGITHTIGIGSGFSMDLVKKGAQAGQGEYLTILNTNNMSAKIIGLLTNILKPKLTDFSIKYNQQLFDQKGIKIPNRLAKGRPNTIYLQYSSKAGAWEELFNSQDNTLEIKYFDQEKNEQISQVIPLKPTYHFDQLDKFYAKLKIDQLLQTPTNENKTKAIELSQKSQILCKYTAFLCKIKQNPEPKSKPKQSYYLKMKTSLQGKSQLKKKYDICDISIKTLTGKSLTFTTPLTITVQQLKQMVQQAEGIPPDQQRMIFAGKQLYDDYTLEDSGMENQSVVYLVLRLRGGDGGSSRGPPRYTLSVGVGGKLVSVREPEINQQTLVQELYKKVVADFPILKNLKFTITYQNNVLEAEKHLNDYKIPSGARLTVEGVPAYLLNIDELIKLVKVNGSWKYDEDIIINLGLKQTFDEKLVKYSADNDKAMTDTVITYLKKNYPQRKQQFALIYKKAAEFLNKS